MAFYSIIVLLVFVPAFFSQGAIITVPPVSVTAPPYTTATVTCEGTGDILVWWVQSAVLTDSIKQQREITVTTTTVNNTNFSSVLTVNAIPINDGMGIGCEVITFNPYHRDTSNCNLTIRGVSSVEDLQYDFTSNNSLLITWSPPGYYSKDVSIESFVSYQVLVTDEEDGDIILDETIANRKIKVVNVTQCDTFNISVTVILAQYTSTDTDSNNGKFSITEYDTQPLIPSISFELGCPSSRCIVSLMDGNTEVTDIITETESIIGFKLSPFRHYELTAVVKNLRGKTKATYNTSISTFHTQDIIISSSYTNGSVSVQCVFVLGSTADGCHVIFNDTDQEIIESFTITGPGSTIVTVSASGVYDVYVYDIVNGSLYGPAVQDTTLVEIVKVIPSTSSSIISESTLPTTQSTVANTVSSTTTSISVTEPTSSTTKTTNDNDSIIVPFVAGTVSVTALLILIILAVCVGIIVNKRKKIKGIFKRSEIATAQQPKAETNQYQDVQELRNEGPNNTSAVLLTNRPIYEENPYHITRSEFLTVNHSIPLHNVEGQLILQEPCPSLASTATQETTLGNSISSITLNDIHGNDTITVTVTDTGTGKNEATTVTNTAANVAPTYAVVAKRTDATPLPTVDQCVVYNEVTGDRNKRGGGVTVYQPSDDISAIPPPSSYADTIAQEHGATVSSPRFKIPEQETDDAAMVHGKYEKYPQTNIENYHANTPVQAETYTTDDEVVQSKAPLAILDSNFANDREGGPIIDESPMNGEEISPIQFRENMSFEMSLRVDSPFEEAEIVHDHSFDHISDEMVGVKPRPVVLNSRKKTGTLVTGLPSKVELTTACHEAQASKNEYQTQKVPKVNTQHL